MKLNQCTLGKLVITKDKRIGHIVGIAYNAPIEFSGNFSEQERLERTVPVVKFPEGERSVHPSNLEEFK